MESEFAGLIVIASFVVLVFVLSITLFVVKYKRKVLEKDLQLERVKRDTQLQVFKAAIEAEERQKELIAINLHDSINPELTLVQNAVSLVARDVDADSGEKLRRAALAIGSGIVSIRAVCHNLMPNTLEELGLVNTLGRLVYNVRQSMALMAEFRTSGADGADDLTKNSQLAIYRVAQELINNVLKHASATRIILDFNVNDGTVIMELLHNGKGITSQDIPRLNKKGLGLKSIESRLLALGGEIRYERAAGGEFRTVVSVPLEPNLARDA